MILKKLNGYVEDGSSYISILIEGGDNNNSIGDQVWFSGDGREMHIDELSNEETLLRVLELFTGNSKRAFRGAMIRMGVRMPNIY